MDWVAVLGVTLSAIYVIVLKNTDMGLIDAWFTTRCALISLTIIVPLLLGILLGIPYLVWQWLSSFIGGA